jgi:hypothetical protein
VLEGDVSFEIDGRRLSAGPGTSVYMPRGVPHGFLVESAVASMLGVMVPGDFERLFRTLSVPATARTLPPAGTVPLELAAVMAEQLALGTQVVGPPMPELGR